MLHPWREIVTARSLSLWFLSIAAPDTLRAGTLIKRAGIFEIEPAAVRVALGRLIADGLAEQTERGVYRLGASAAAMHVKARSWMRVEASVRDWDGTWTIILTHHLGRSDRARLQARERALRLTGFATGDTEVWLRPDNLAPDVEALAEELIHLGLDAQAFILQACEARSEDDTRFRRLWPVKELEAGYQFWIKELKTSGARMSGLPEAEAARETFLLGQSVIRTINSDPLLPSELVNTKLRREMVDAMISYYAMALRIWEPII